MDLQTLARSPDLDPQLALLTLPVLKEPDLGPCAQRIMALRPDLIELILPILSERFQGLTPSQIMATLGISKDFWRHTRAFQDILQEGRQEGVPPPAPGSKPSACRNWKVWPWPCSISRVPKIYRPGWSRWNPEGRSNTAMIDLTTGQHVETNPK